MDSFVLKFFIFLFILSLTGVEAMYSYRAIAAEDAIIAPCDGPESKFYVDKYFDLDKIKFNFLDDEFIVNGVIKLKKDFPAHEKYEYKFISFQKKQGQWVQTILSMHRLDFCDRILDPNEVWYKNMKPFEKELTPCPPKGGTEFVFDNFKASSIINVTDRNLAGLYKLVNRLNGSKGTKICFQVSLDLSLIE